MTELFNVYSPAELMPGIFINVQNTIPCCLLKRKNVFDLVTDGGIEVGDTFTLQPFPKHKVTKVLKSRPAKGDWSGKLYDKKTPIWCQVIAEEVPIIPETKK